MGRASPWERRASQGCQARPEEAREPAEPRALPREHFGHAVLPQPDVPGKRAEARVAVDDLARVRPRVRGWVRVEVKVRARARVVARARVRGLLRLMTASGSDVDSPIGPPAGTAGAQKSAVPSVGKAWG